MTTTLGSVAKDHGRSAGLPFAIAFGFALATSSAVGAAVPSLPYASTSVQQLVQPSPPRYMLMPIDHTSSGLPTLDREKSNVASVSPAKRVSEIRALTGLTIDQVSRLFGVSRRSVHNWISGSVMSQQHEERAAKILAIVQALPGSTAAERRAALLDSSLGTSLFHQLVAERGEGVRLQVPGVSARARIEL